MLHLRMFCFGCSVKVGVRIILLVHGAILLAVLGTLFTSCVLEASSASLAGPFAAQMLLAMWCIIGLAAIVAAGYGVANFMQRNISLYFYYLLLTSVLDLAYIVHQFIFMDVCGPSNGELRSVLSARYGTAFMCGVLRIISMLAVAGAAGTELYALLTVWSFWEDVCNLRATLRFPDLLYNKPAAHTEVDSGFKGQE
eukprot:5007231-Amphidinium_carterae.1